MPFPGAPSHTTTGGSSGSRRAVREQRRSVENAEHAGDLRRFRAGVLVSFPTWCGFGLLDWYSATAGSSDPRTTLTWLWSIRWGLLPLVAFVLWGTYKTPAAGPRFLRILDTTLYGAAAFGIALMAVGYHGIESAYIPGIMMVQIARGAFSAQHWKDAIPMNLLMASATPIVMGVASFFVPAIRAQLHDPAALATAVQLMSFLYGTVVLMVASTHYAWTLRRQLFESRSIGRYRLERRIAAGGMGEVWAAYHPGLKRNIALKILRAEAANDENAVLRFEREVKATSDLSHPNTIRVFDFGTTDDGIFYYAMELLEGKTLAELVKTEGPLPQARAVHLVLQTARALAEAHARGIVHRDVKPANIFVTNAGGEPDFVKVLDFGIAKRIDELKTEDDADLTEAGAIAGTPKYMAPESVMRAEVTARSDVYGIGAVLYYLLTGRAPFEGATATAVYAALLSDDVRSPSAARGEPIAPALEALVLRCLAKEPERRFADAGELAAALRELDEAVLGASGTSLRPPPLSNSKLFDPDTPTVITK